MRRPLTFEQITARLFALDLIRQQRPLTDAERAERDNLDYRRDLRLRRLGEQIARTEAKLSRLRSIAGERRAA